MKTSPCLIRCFTTLLLSMLPVAAVAGPLTGSCVVGTQPAASLLLPYFAVDLGDSSGLTTMMSIGNRAPSPTLARVVLWSDWAVPLYAFDLLLPGKGLQSLNLRNVVQHGNIPETGEGMEPAPHCASPLHNPPLDAAARAALQAALTGRPSAIDGLCRGSDRGQTSLAVGYVTVDVLHECSDTVRYPTDEGYFATDGSGLAGYDNVLYGDWFLLDPSQNLAQGSELVHLVADPDFFEANQAPSFYRLYSHADHRLPLSSQWQTRFLSGGGFDGNTEFLLWIEPIFTSTPLPCGESPQRGAVTSAFSLRPRTEDGVSISYQLQEPIPGDAFVRRVPFSALHLLEPATSGVMELVAFANCAVCSPPFLGDQQSWVVPLFSASDRFSVGTGAVPLNDLCAQP